MQNIFRDEQIIDGTRFYIKDDSEGTLVIADKWDAMFKPVSTGKPNLKTKGLNPDRRKLWMQNKKSY